MKVRAGVALIGIGIAMAGGCAPPPAEAPIGAHRRPIVVLETDFGARDDAAAILKGVVLSIVRDADIVDLSHEIPPFDIETGAQNLEDAPGIFPEKTVFVVVVDPGVGTARRGIAVELANGRYLVGPDNGVLSLAMQRWGVRHVREIASPAFQREHQSETFHGRDVFAPCGAHLALGAPPFDRVGPEVTTWVKLPASAAVAVRASGDASAAIVALDARVAKIDDPFGNLWTNVTEADLAPVATAYGERLVFDFGGKPPVTAPLVKTFGDVAEGQPLAYWNSRGRLSLAINMGDAAKKLGVARGDKVRVSRAK